MVECTWQLADIGGEKGGAACSALLALLSDIIRDKAASGAAASRLRCRACELVGVISGRARNVPPGIWVSPTTAIVDALNRCYTDGHFAEAALYSVRGLVQDRDCRVRRGEGPTLPAFL